MVIYSKNESQMGPLTKRTTDRKSTSDPQVAMLIDYFSQLDGSPDALENAKPILSSMLHPDFELVLGDLEIGYDRVFEMLAKFTQNGCIAKLEKATKDPDGSVTVTVHNYLGNSFKETGTRKLFYEDDMIIGIEPVGQAAEYSAFLQRVAALPLEDTDIAWWREYVSKYDGSESAWENVEPLLRDHLHPDFKQLITNHGEIDYDGTLELARKATKNGCIRNLEEARKDPDGSLVVRVSNRIPGEDVVVAEHRFFFQDGKVIRGNTAAADESKFTAFIQRISALPIEDPDIAELRNYLSKYDGSASAWNNVEPLIRARQHPNFKLIINKDMVIRYGDAIKLAYKATQNGCVRRLIKAWKNPDGSLSFRVYNSMPGEDGEISEQTVFYQDGKTIRIEISGSEKAKYQALVGRISALPDHQDTEISGELDEIAKRFNSFISAFDGSPDALSRAMPLLRELVHPDFVFVTDKGEQGMDWFLSFVRSFASNRNIAIVREVERTDTGLRAVITNIVEGKDMGTTEQRGVVKNGRIIHWETMPGSEIGFNKMIDSVLLQT